MTMDLLMDIPKKIKLILIPDNIYHIPTIHYHLNLFAQSFTVFVVYNYSYYNLIYLYKNIEDK